MSGILLIDKPAGWTSFDVVNYVRRIVATALGKRPKSLKVGHTGTLDPFATGLLVILIGQEYTKKAGELAKVDKSYEVEFRLGETSTTGDPEGQITAFGQPELLRVLTKAEIIVALEQFMGQISQVPPAYSAIKINGQRAYQLARAGKAVQIAPRMVTVYRLELLSYAYPDVKIVAEVSSGTYIRTLVEDIGKLIGCGAYTTALRRTKVGKWEIKAAISLDNLDSQAIEKATIQAA